MGFISRVGEIIGESNGKRLYISPYIELGDSGTALVDRKTFGLLGLNGGIYDSKSYAIPINLFKPYLK